MPSNYSTIGLVVRRDDDLLALARQAASGGTAIGSSRGAYYRLTDTSGAEVWAQVDDQRQLVGVAPHFAGATRMRVNLTARVTRESDTPLDGAFHAWALDDLEPDDEQEGYYPFVFDVPDGGVHDDLVLPAQRAVQIAAFARECDFFADADAFSAAQPEEPRFAAQSFIPSGLFEADDEPPALALFTGKVVGCEERVNTWTGARFHWAHVRTYGGELDVVADPELVTGEPVTGGVVRVSAWLSGRFI